jgi:NADH dehydrogenase FAD-containing subunit
MLTYVRPTMPSRPFAVGDLVDVMDRDGKTTQHAACHASRQGNTQDPLR